jgi:hypothetical protein
MDKCSCGSYAINRDMPGRNGTHMDLCDVCFWRERAKAVELWNTYVRTNHGLVAQSADAAIEIGWKPNEN